MRYHRAAKWVAIAFIVTYVVMFVINQAFEFLDHIKAIGRSGSVDQKRQTLRDWLSGPKKTRTS